MAALENIKASFDKLLREAGSTKSCSYDPPSIDGVVFRVNRPGEGVALVLPRVSVDDCEQGTTPLVEIQICKFLSDNPQLLAAV